MWQKQKGNPERKNQLKHITTTDSRSNHVWKQLTGSNIMWIIQSVHLFHTLAEDC